MTEERLQRRIAVLFGAGASYGAGSIAPESPPLGLALYDALVQSYPASWGGLSQDVQAVFRSSGFEAGMRVVYDRHGQAIPQLMREMAVYFVQFRPVSRNSLYCRLVRDLLEDNVLSQVGFSSLNYDCILEYSLLEAGASVEYFPDNHSANAVPVWKLHGSCNMFAHGVQAGQGVLYGTGVTWEGGAQAFFDSNRVIEHCLVETGLAPIMSLYMEGKPLNVSPSVIHQIQQAWSASVSTAKAIFVVGVRPLVADAHVWAPLATAQAPLYFIGDRTDFAKWTETQRPEAPSSYLGSRFANGYAELLTRMRTHGTD